MEPLNTAQVNHSFTVKWQFSDLLYHQTFVKAMPSFSGGGYRKKTQTMEHYRHYNMDGRNTATVDHLLTLDQTE